MDLEKAVTQKRIYFHSDGQFITILTLRSTDLRQCLQEQEHSGEQSKMRQLPASELLVQMPFLQKLLQRLLDCKPTGAASRDAVVPVCPAR